MDVAAIGLAGAAFCIAIQMRSRKAASSRAQAVDRFVERLERSTEPAGAAITSAGAALAPATDRLSLA
jgi:hypothetical protein